MKKTTINVIEELQDINKAISGLYCGLFSEFETVNEAMEYATDIFNTMSPSDKIAGLTALQVVLNTVVKNNCGMNDKLIDKIAPVA